MQPNRRALQPTREVAEVLAIQAFAFIAEEPQSLSRFLEASGLSAERVRAASREPGFLAGVLEHILGDESLLVAFAHGAGIDAADVARAARVLGTQWERDLP
jgi:hypothetical protein